jgi:nucleoside-diphosphate-sugar epimerase
VSTKEKKKILITGINSYVGSWISNQLADKYDIIGISRSVLKQKNSKIEYHTVKSYFDLSSDTFKNVDTVIHLAARVHVFDNEKNNNDLFIKDNVELTRFLAEKAIQQNVSRFVFLSTAGVHGYKTVKQMSFDETSPVDCHNFYTESKLAAEKEIYKLYKNSSLDFCILRAPLIYGWNAPGNFHKLEKLGKMNIPFVPHIQNKKNFIGILNLVDAFKNVIDYNGPIKDTFLVTDPFTVSTTDLLTEVGRVSKIKKISLWIPKMIFWLVFFIFGKKKLYDQLFGDFRVNSSQIAHKFGWKAPYSLHQNLEITKTYSL